MLNLRDRRCGILGALARDFWRHAVPPELKIPIEAAAKKLDALLIGESLIVDDVDDRANDVFSGR